MHNVYIESGQNDQMKAGRSELNLWSFFIVAHRPIIISKTILMISLCDKQVRLGLVKVIVFYACFKCIAVNLEFLELLISCSRFLML